MIPKAVTFDCAQTLVEVQWTPDGLVKESMECLGKTLPEDDYRLYHQLFVDRFPEFAKLNELRDPIVGAQFWRQLGQDWLEQVGQPLELLEPLIQEADRLAFGPATRLFRLYDDVVPCLVQLKSLGIRLAVLSNWDYSLHRVIQMFGLDIYFEAVLASLEEGAEKPDPRFFSVCQERLALDPADIVHIGDNPVDDVEGAQGSGFRVLLIDRAKTEPAQGIITTFAQLPEAFAWTV